MYSVLVCVNIIIVRRVGFKEEVEMSMRFHINLECLVSI